MCSDPSKVCGMLWSGATPAESKFANDYYYWWMTTNGQQSNLPSQACPAPQSNADLEVGGPAELELGVTAPRARRFGGRRGR